VIPDIDLRERSLPDENRRFVDDLNVIHDFGDLKEGRESRQKAFERLKAED
jgi:hypothetical protein